MAQALPFFKAVAAFVIGKGAVATLVRTVLINVTIGKLSKLLTKKPRVDVPPINVTVRNPVENRRLVFGTVRCGGTFAFIGASGDNNKYLWYVVVFAGHQVHAIRDVWLDQVLVTNDQIGGGAASGGAVTSGFFANKLWIYKHLGTSAQAADSNLIAAFPSRWTSNHKLSGCAYIVVRMERDDEKYPSGAPQSVTALVDGALCYDPRKDSTVPGGSGSHRKNDPRTWEFTRNPALHVRWYLTGGSVHNDVSSRLVMYGMKLADERVPDEYVVAAANICDEVLTGANAPPGGSEPRYRCDIEVSTGETRGEILDHILATMAGTVIRASGEWRIYAGAYDVPSHSLSSDDLYGELEVEDTWDHRRRYNAVAGVYRDALKQWVEQTTIFRTDSNYETQDGGRRIPIELDLRGVTSPYQAQRLCEIKLRKSRMQRTVRLVGALNLLKVALHETLTLTHERYGWNERIFRCVERQFEFSADAGRVTLTCEQEDPAVWADMETADYTTGTSDTDRFITDTPDAPSNLRTNGLPNAIEVAWDQPAHFPGGTRYRLQESTSANMAGAVDVALTPDRQVILRKNDTTTYYYRVRAEHAGEVSAWVPSGNGVAGSALSTTPDLTASVSPGAVNTQTTNSTATSAPVTVTASGGTPPYTYAWTRVSGASTITADSATAATTTFSCTGLDPSEVNEAVFRCTVTDSAGSPDTATVDVSVRFERLGLQVTANNVGSTRTGGTNCGIVTAGNPNVTVANGSGSYTYSWSRVGAPAANPFVISSNTAQNPTWTATVCNTVAVETWQVTVTDTATGATASAIIQVQLKWINLS